MAFFDCVSDFVDSRRNPLPDSSDRILLLKPNFTEATKREQLTREILFNYLFFFNSFFSADQKPETITSLSNIKQQLHSPTPPSIEIDRPIVDLSSFVSLDFQYRSLEYTSNEPFYGFLGDVEDPWNIHIGNIQFIPNRNRMMNQLQYISSLYTISHINFSILEIIIINPLINRSIQSHLNKFKFIYLVYTVIKIINIIVH